MVKFIIIFISIYTIIIQSREFYGCLFLNILNYLLLINNISICVDVSKADMEYVYECKRSNQCHSRDSKITLQAKYIDHSTRF